MILKYNSKLLCVMKELLTFSSFKMVSVKFWSEHTKPIYLQLNSDFSKCFWNVLEYLIQHTEVATKILI